MWMSILNQLLQGVMVGGLYALFALGLAISSGILRFVNVAHGDLIVMVSYLFLSLVTGLGLHPLLAAVLLLPLCFGGAWLLQRVLLHRVVGQGVLPVILVTFGLSVIVQNGLQGVYGADTRKVAALGFESATWSLGGGVNIGALPLTIFVAAVLMIGGLDRFLYRTRRGAQLRAIADDVQAASLVGLPTQRLYGLAMGLVGLTVAVAASFMAVWTNFDPSAGPNRLLIAFEVVVLAGLGSLWGTLAGGILIGLAQTVGAQVDTAWQSLAGHLVFLAVFLVRPQGLFPKY